MDGVLVIDKPGGLTSHDVVATVRRALSEKRVGHTGTLDPLATGVLPLVCGRATRLVRFLAAADKEYEAIIRFGIATDTFDITGSEVRRTGRIPPREAVETALESLRGDYLQMPPAYSAKKVAGRRAYDLAREQKEVALQPVPVRVSEARLVELTGSAATVRITCSAGFYVRSFAEALGTISGSAACLEALRRTRSGDFGLDAAVTLDELRRPAGALERLIPLEGLLPRLPAVGVTDEGRRRIAHGQAIETLHLSAGPHGGHAPEAAIGGRLGSDNQPAADWVRLLDAEGRLVALATRRAGTRALHPSVVLI